MAPHLRFCGAARTVTGSCFLVDTGKARVLVDCGMFQGSKTEKELNYGSFPFDPAALDAVLLTHAHIDHSGLLPKLTRAGYRGTIHATEPTMDLCSVMLPDSASIQESEVEFLNRRNRRSGQPEVAPIYTVADAEACVDLFRPVDYRRWVAVADGVRARFWNAGHLLGSASVEIEAETGGDRLRILFSGDIGPDEKMLHPDPDAPAGFDWVVCESTYGATDRHDRAPAQRRARLAAEVTAAAARGGAMLVPSFAVERTQEVVTDLIGLMDSGAVPRAPVFIDSPLAIRASDVFLKHARHLEGGQAMVRAFRSPDLRFALSVEDSKAVGRLRGFHIVVAASGMCEAGRIRHHLENHLWRADATVLMVGYQAEGTLGRLLLDGADPVRIRGEAVRVRATIRSIDSYSGHADGTELAAWIAARGPIRRGLFLVHGEMPAINGLTGRIADRPMPRSRVVAPLIDDVYDLSAGEPRVVHEGLRRRIAPEHVAHLDWHNDLSRLILDINDRVAAEPDERARQVLLRRLRRALHEPV